MQCTFCSFESISMIKLVHNDMIVLLSSIGGILISVLIFAELGKKIKMPIVMGEILLGIILGPRLFGTLSPDSFSFIFPKVGAAKIAMDGITTLAVVIVLFVAGMEVQLHIVFQQGKIARY